MSASEFTLLGIYLKKIEFWNQKKGYEFAFQFWIAGQLGVFIYREDVEIASFGGQDTPLELFVRVCEWAEKTNPSIKYPSHLEISNVQP